MAKIAALILALTMLVGSAVAQESFGNQVLNAIVPEILLKEYNNVATAENYNFSYKTSDGSERSEIGMIMNPGTEQEELVVMGMFMYMENGIETMTVYTADKNGYKPRVTIKNRKLNPKLLASLAGK